jgi:hypothetical protein
LENLRNRLEIIKIAKEILTNTRENAESSMEIVTNPNGNGMNPVRVYDSCKVFT